MTNVKINPGSCGFNVVIEAEKKDKKTCRLKITSDCKMVHKLGVLITELSLADAFKKYTDNPIYRKSSACLKHAACPVPSGILKALEVEMGLNIPKDVSITFSKGK